MLDGIRLAVTTLTVLPLRAGRVDRSAAAVAMAVAPAVGALLGLVLAGLHEGLRALGSPVLVAAGVTVAAGALLTRGLHLDGLADTVDALGSYRSGPAALEIMKKPDIGPFGVVALAATVLVQTAAVASAGPWAIVTAWAAGRLAITVACRRGVPAARPEGLGALVASTVPLWALTLGAASTALLGAAAVPDRPWQGPVAVVAAGFAVVLLLRHAVRRLGGVTGDVLGACVELAVTITLVVVTLG
ncbi:adenosylcobinamide-GDP ribazoletransferase [Actinoplanes couchii]|uniref:Adenosylcobinamide-GDP ribazoletransferase n=1 Tax=Actinoplanes couchii TaxID=403638 RepID=A0ABQ3X392_9ACTN|nr:adenosylcobinamide-GDP ribazoletransferase [Actinoplanes couchii]MDR6322748.1 adenosylcobinamide-GDP ribazoletransferase [Actinoplanes couchii]GID52986.1 adenosylcobinamide-GDP ribazoletransferase [Actinoplanes couchii]